MLLLHMRQGRGFCVLGFVDASLHENATPGLRLMIALPRCPLLVKPWRKHHHEWLRHGGAWFRDCQGKAVPAVPGYLVVD